jgi:hypothetical protein
MQTEISNQTPKAYEHIDEAELAVRDAAAKRHAWTLAEIALAEAQVNARKAREAYTDAVRRAGLLAREAAEIEGAAA